MKPLVQCKSCPWRKDVVPERDIPGGYCPTKHAALRETVAMPGRLESSSLKKMACHKSPVGAEFACAGWLENQLGPGNNLTLRLEVARGTIPAPRTAGPQHETLEDTLPAFVPRQLSHEVLKLIRMRAWAAGEDPDEAERLALEMAP